MDEEQIITLFFARSEQAIEALDAKYGKLFHSLSYHIVNDRQDGKKDLLAARAPMEESFFTRNAEIEQEYISLQKKNPKKAAALLNSYAQECADKIMQTYRDLRNQLLVKYTNNK